MSDRLKLVPASVRVAVYPSPPYIEYFEPEKRWQGIFIDFLWHVCGFLRHTCILQQPPLVGLKNETLDGVMGAVANKTAEMGIAPLGISVSRIEHFTLIDSLFPRTYMVVVHKNHLISAAQSDFFWNTLEKLASPYVLAVMIGVVISFSVIGIVMEECHSRQGKRSPLGIKRFASWVIKLFGMGLGVEGIEDFESARVQQWPTSKMIFYATWCLYTLTILCTISGQLSYVFTFSAARKLPFEDVESLLSANFTVYGSATAIDMLNASRISYQKELAQKVLVLNSSTTNVTYSSVYAQYLDLAMGANTALILSHEALLDLSFYSCDIFLAIDHLGTLRVASFVLPKNSPLRNGIERGFAKATQDGLWAAGIQQYERYMRLKSHARMDTCYKKTLTDASKFRKQAISLESFAFLIALWGYGCCLGCFLFIYEYVMWVRKRNRQVAT